MRSLYCIEYFNTIASHKLRYIRINKEYKVSRKIKNIFRNISKTNYNNLLMNDHIHKTARVTTPSQFKVVLFIFTNTLIYLHTIVLTRYNFVDVFINLLKF